MNVKRVLELLRKGFNFKFFLDKFTLNSENLVFKQWYFLTFFHKNSQLSALVSFFVIKQLKVSKSISKSSLSSSKSSLLYLYLFI